MKYKVKRAFYLAGTVQAEGSEIELTDRELIGGLKSFGKIEAVVSVDGEVEKTTGPMTTENTGLVASNSRRKD